MGDPRFRFQELRDSGILNFGDGYRAKNAELGGQGPIFLRAAYLQDAGFVLDEPDRFKEASIAKFGPKVAQTGDVVITTKGNSTGRIGAIRESEAGSVYSPHLSYWRSLSPEVLDQRYLYFWSRSEDFRGQLYGLAHATDMAPYLSLRDQASLTIPLPPIEQQQAAAAILGVLDDKIELNRRMNETLEAMARAIFKDWFVDFGPTRAKAEGRAPYLAPEIWDLFPDALDDEDKPVGWRASTLGQNIEILDAKRIPLSSREREKRQGPYPYHGATGIMDHVDDYLFEGVHVLMGEDGSVVKPDGQPYTQYVWGRFWVNNHAHVLKGSGISNEMLLSFLQQIDVAPFVTGAVQPKLNQRNLRVIPFPASSPRVAECFDRIVSPLYGQLRQNSEQSATLAATRDLLLPKLMSGEIRLAEAEKTVEAVA